VCATQGAILASEAPALVDDQPKLTERARRAKDTRAQRLAAAMRLNLKRRKAQARARAVETGTPATPVPPNRDWDRDDG
jgi:hypothetical protein